MYDIWKKAIFKMMSNIIFFLIPTLLSIVVVTLCIFVLMKSKRSGDVSDFRENISEQFDRLYSMINQNLDSSMRQSSLLNDQVSKALFEINKTNRDNMALMLSQQDTITKGQLKQLQELQHIMVDNLDRIRKANSEAFVEIVNKSDKLLSQVHMDMDMIRKENNEKLEQMRAVVDEKLQQTLDARIAKSFKEVTDNLSKLYESLGSLNTLTNDVQNITKIFSNVKTRGIWGEVQAESILDDILTPEQYEKDYSPRSNREKVEFAIKLPGRNDQGAVYLPIDSKFPIADYTKYKDAMDLHDETGAQRALKNVRERILFEAKDIQRKYIVTPETTDFAILFVPAESIYIELLRMPDFVDRLQDEYRVILTGPNNFSALLNSLRLGFKTLQIERYTSQIWHSFETLKKYFADLSKAIEDSKKAVDKASEHLDGASRKKDKLSSVLLQMENTAEKTSFLKSCDVEASCLIGENACCKELKEECYEFQR